MANKIILTSSDGVSFEIDEVVACESQTIKHIIEDDCASNGIPLHNVTGKTLAKVIEYCKKHIEAAAEAKADDRDVSGFTEDDELRKWDAEFVNVDQSLLFDIIMASNYLNIKGLLDLTCKTLAEMMKGKTPQQMRDLFNIKNDYTVEEETQVVMENAWAFE